MFFGLKVDDSVLIILNEMISANSGFCASKFTCTSTKFYQTNSSSQVFDTYDIVNAVPSVHFHKVSKLKEKQVEFAILHPAYTCLLLVTSISEVITSCYQKVHSDTINFFKHSKSETLSFGQHICGVSWFKWRSWCFLCLSRHCRLKVCNVLLTFSCPDFMGVGGVTHSFMCQRPGMKCLRPILCPSVSLKGPCLWLLGNERVGARLSVPGCAVLCTDM